MKNRTLFNKFKLLSIVLLIFVNNAIAQCWSKISAGTGHTLAIKQDGSLWAWGSNYQGELGTGNTNSVGSPIQIGNDYDWASISAGSAYSLAIKTNGTLWGWGRNQYFQIGNGYAGGISLLIPSQIGTETNWAQVSAGDSHTMAIKLVGNTRTLWACGSNLNGKLGFETTSGNYLVEYFTQVGTFTNWTFVDCGKDHTIALRLFSQSGRTLWSWGSNNTGQLGIGSTIDTNFPTQVGTDNNWTSCRAGSNHNLARKNNGTLWSWGNNFDGQLGLYNNLNQTSPVQIGTETIWEETNYDCGTSFNIAKKTNGKLYSWGKNNLGQLGQGDNSNLNYPWQVTIATNWGGLVSAGFGHFSVYRNDGFLFLGGLGGSGQLGNGTFSSINSPAAIVCPVSLDINTFIKNENIQIFPNPTTNILNIKTNNNSIIDSIKIFDVLGQIIYEISENTNKINLQFLPKGTYIIQIKNSQQIQFKKIIKN